MIKNIIRQAKDELNKRPLVAVDNLIDVFSEAETMGSSRKEIFDLLNLFCQAVLKSAGKLWCDDPIAGLFDKSLSPKNQRFVGTCLLRLLSSSNQCFKVDDLRVKPFLLFDKVFSDDLYSQLKIEKKQQVYKKKEALKDAVPQIESELSGFISSLKNLDMLSKSKKFRHTFMRKINQPLSKAIIRPFLPEELLNVRLDEVFKVVEEYLKEEGPGMIQVFESTRSTLETYLSDAEQYGTKYSREYLGGLTKKLIDLMRNHLKNSTISEPARLIAKESGKKYPFYAKDKDFNLSFVVQNPGPGYAFDVYFKAKEMTDLIFKKPELYLGNLGPTSIVVEIPVKVNCSTEFVLISLELNWTNFDKTISKEEFLLELNGQRSDIPWEKLKLGAPYSLEPVETENELVGRREILEQLITRARVKKTESSYIFGQKRVGKTSIVKTLKTSLMGLNLSDYLVVYFERGDYQHPDPIGTIKKLGSRICGEIKKADTRFKHLQEPDLTDALSPLTEFLDSVLEIAPNYRILFILDEFDELPPDLYKRGPVSDAFFGTLRSISGKSSFNFILVGGEGMDYIMNFQGHALNKFHSIQLDYFDREKHWSDFQELVRRPVEPWLEIKDDAVVALYEQTAGNPFFTKLILESLLQTMVERRDCHITQAEVKEAATFTIKEKTATNKVDHFWSDGIFEPDNHRKEEISMLRKKILLCFAEAFRKYQLAEENYIIEQGKEAYGIDSHILKTELRTFQRRQVIIKKK